MSQIKKNDRVRVTNEHLANYDREGVVTTTYRWYCYVEIDGHEATYSYNCLEKVN